MVQLLSGNLQCNSDIIKERKLSIKPIETARKASRCGIRVSKFGEIDNIHLVSNSVPDIRQG